MRGLDKFTVSSFIPVILIESTRIITKRNSNAYYDDGMHATMT